jgi:hypothetical protein
VVSVSLPAGGLLVLIPVAVFQASITFRLITAFPMLSTNLGCKSIGPTTTLAILAE